MHSQEEAEGSQGEREGQQPDNVGVGVNRDLQHELVAVFPSVLPAMKMDTDADGDAFAWTDGQADGSLPATQAYATVGDIPTEWGRWSPAGDGTSGAFVLNGTGVPAPGVLALLGLAGTARRRRRH